MISLSDGLSDGTIIITDGLRPAIHLSTLWRTIKEVKAKAKAIVATMKFPLPQARPMAIDIHIVAAVVRPFTSKPLFNMAPAPKKPTPVTTCAAKRAGSRLPPVQ